MNTAIITGAGGFIGARLAGALLGRGWRVHALGRGGAAQPWRARMIAALVDIGGHPPDGALLERLRCHEADLTRPGLGLSCAARDEITAEPAVLIHSAADTRFNAPDPAAQRRINAGACREAIEALGRNLERAIHVSTAYVAGARTGTVYEDETDTGQSFHNPYERSKLEGEILFRAACERRGIAHVVARPSIVINDMRTGRSPALTSLNMLVELAGRLWDHYGLGFGQTVSSQIRIRLDPAARANLIPVDPVIAALVALATHPHAPGKTCHLCHPDPRPNGEVFQALADELGIGDKTALRFVRELAAPVSRTESLIHHASKLYAPYMTSHCLFDLTQTRALIPGYDALCGRVDRAYLRKVVAYQLARRQEHRKERESHEFACH